MFISELLLLVTARGTVKFTTKRGLYRLSTRKLTVEERESEDLSTSSIFGSAKASQEADNVLIIQDKRLTAVRGKKYLQVAKNRYSGDLGIVPLDFDKDALSYQAKKKKNKPEDPDKLLDQCFDELSINDDNKVTKRDFREKMNSRNKKDTDSYLSDLLNLNRTR